MASRPPARFDPRELLDALAGHGVEFLVVGGVAARLHGSPTLTQDLDIVAAASEGNLARLAEALNGLEPAEIVPARNRPVPTTVTADSVRRGWVTSFLTRHGRIDLLWDDADDPAFAELRERSSVFDLGDGLRIRAAALDDVIAAKEAAGRPKDRADLERLYLLRDELG